MPTKKKNFKNFSSYCSYLFSDSLLTGISPIFKSKGCLGKFVNIFILAASLTGFLYQTFQFLQHYWEYSTVVSESRTNIMLKPAVSICPANILRRSFFCKSHPEFCGRYDYRNHRFISCLERKEYCEDQKKIMYLTVNLQKFPDEVFDWNVTKIGGCQFQDIVLSCKLYLDVDSQNQSNEETGISCGNEKYFRALDLAKVPHSCYSLDSQVGETNNIAKYLKHNAEQMMTLKWTLRERLKHGANYTYWVSFHDPEELVNPFDIPVHVQIAVHAKLIVHQETTVRLPPPYDTRCHDYKKDWIKNGGKGPLNKEECLAQCDIMLYLEEYGCVHRKVTIPHEEKLCPEPPSYDKNFMMKTVTCKEKCADACLEIKYISTMEILDQVQDRNSSKRFGAEHVSIVEIEFNPLESKIISYTPKYKSMEVLSYIGGYIGVWLGWPIIALMDFIGTITKLFYYAWVKGRKMKKNITRYVR